MVCIKRRRLIWHNIPVRYQMNTDDSLLEGSEVSLLFLLFLLYTHIVIAHE